MEKLPFQIRVISHAGEVLVTFSEPSEAFTLSPVGAREMGGMLIAMADAIEQAHVASKDCAERDNAALKH